jgi:nucleoside-diphosphate-sugar epimerase
MHVLVAGCGWLGRAVGRALRARGDRVTGIRRDRARAAALREDGIEPLALDLAGPGVVDLLPPDLDAVVACQSAGADTEDAYRSAYVEANRSLLSYAGRRALRAFVYTGSTGVFGQRDGSDVDEGTAPSPSGPTAAVLVEAERFVLSAAERVPARIVRLSGLYGPGRAGLADRVRAGKLGLGPGDEAWMNFCHLEDAVAFVLAALDRGRPGVVYHGSDAHPATRREVVTWVAGRLGIPPPRAEAAPPGPNRRILSLHTRAELGVSLAWPSFRDGFGPLLPASPREG